MFNAICWVCTAPVPGEVARAIQEPQEETVEKQLETTPERVESPWTLCGSQVLQEANVCTTSIMKGHVFEIFSRMQIHREIGQFPATLRGCFSLKHQLADRSGHSSAHYPNAIHRLRLFRTVQL